MIKNTIEILRHNQIFRCYLPKHTSAERSEHILTFADEMNALPHNCQESYSLIRCKVFNLLLQFMYKLYTKHFKNFRN